MSGYRYALNFFTYVPKVYKGQSDGFTITSNPILMLRYVPPKGTQVNYKESYFKITQKNLYRTVKFLNRAVSWFYDKDLRDLFLEGDNHELIFNADYNKLSIITDRDPYNVKNAMKAIPAVIPIADTGKEYEGIYLYITKPEYCVPLPLYEAEAILHCLSNFSFESKICEVLQEYEIAQRLDLIQDIQHNSTSYNKMILQDQWK